ncbi:MAG: multidrug effflux MFS transporter [Alphaproteobacteria bacterium]|nr:multidrug effflux MFS transporter [Alphaproteobacteria bacterium]
MLHRDSRLLVFLLGALTAVGPFNTDTYLPSMPAIREHFGVDMAAVQLTLSLAFVGGAVGQLFYGPLSDRYGRRPLLIAGLSLYVVASAACLFAQSIEQLIVARFLQVFGAICAPVLARAMVRDMHEREAAARMLALMGMVLSMGPILAPFIGGILQANFGWRASFVFVTLYGLALLLSVTFSLGESVKHKDPEALRPSRMAETALRLLSSRVFLGYMLINCFLFGGLGAYLSGIAFVTIEVLDIPPQFFGWVFGTIALGALSGYMISGRLTARLGLDNTLAVGVGGVALAGVILAAFAFAGIISLATLILPMILFMCCFSISGPQAIAGALTPFPRVAGSASSLVGFFQSLTSAAAGMGVALAFDGTPRALAGFVCLMTLSALAAYVLIIRRIPEAERRHVHV